MYFTSQLYFNDLNTSLDINTNIKWHKRLDFMKFSCKKKKQYNFFWRRSLGARLILNQGN